MRSDYTVSQGPVPLEPEEAANLYMEESGLSFFADDDTNVDIHADFGKENTRADYRLEIDATNQRLIRTPTDTPYTPVIEAGSISYFDVLEDINDHGALRYSVHIDTDF